MDGWVNEEFGFEKLCLLVEDAAQGARNENIAMLVENSSGTSDVVGSGEVFEKTAVFGDVG